MKSKISKLEDYSEVFGATMKAVNSEDYWSFYYDDHHHFFHSFWENKYF